MPVCQFQHVPCLECGGIIKHGRGSVNKRPQTLTICLYGRLRRGQALKEGKAAVRSIYAIFLWARLPILKYLSLPVPSRMKSPRAPFIGSSKPITLSFS